MSSALGGTKTSRMENEVADDKRNEKELGWKIIVA